MRVKAGVGNPALPRSRLAACARPHAHVPLGRVADDADAPKRQGITTLGAALTSLAHRVAAVDNAERLGGR